MGGLRAHFEDRAKREKTEYFLGVTDSEEDHQWILRSAVKLGERQDIYKVFRYLLTRDLLFAKIGEAWQTPYAPGDQR